MTRPVVEVADILRAEGNNFIDRHQRRHVYKGESDEALPHGTGTKHKRHIKEHKRHKNWLTNRFFVLLVFDFVLFVVLPFFVGQSPSAVKNKFGLPMLLNR